MSSGQRQIKIMADKKLNELGTIESFDNAYVELSQNQYRISKTNLGKQLANEVHLNFSVASADPAYIFAQKSDGTKFRISKSDLAKAIRNDATGLGGEQPGNRVLYDGCFIMCHKQDDGVPVAVPYVFWPSYQDGGEEADGVLIVEGGHSLVVAPHEKYCRWSSKYGTATDTVSHTSANRIALLDVWDGMERTRKICTEPSSPFYEESNNPSTKNTYAPGYCYNYTPHETGKTGLSAGKYWLPCVAELMMIYTHKYRINAGLALINGANQLPENFWYWSSTEHSATHAWFLNLSDGFLQWSHKVRQNNKVRPVSAFIHDTY